MKTTYRKLENLSLEWLQKAISQNLGVGCDEIY